MVGVVTGAACGGAAALVVAVTLVTALDLPPRAFLLVLVVVTVVLDLVEVTLEEGIAGDEAGRVEVWEC